MHDQNAYIKIPFCLLVHVLNFFRVPNKSLKHPAIKLQPFLTVQELTVINILSLMKIQTKT